MAAQTSTTQETAIRPVKARRDAPTSAPLPRTDAMASTKSACANAVDRAWTRRCTLAGARQQEKGTVGHPTRSPDQQIAFAESLEEKQADDHHDEGGGFPRRHHERRRWRQPSSQTSRTGIISRQDPQIGARTPSFLNITRDRRRCRISVSNWLLSECEVRA